MTYEHTSVYDSAMLGSRFKSEFIELFGYRYLLWNLIIRDLKLRYKRSFLGFLWAMINPLLSMGVLVIVFSKLFRFDIEHYATYVLSGLLIWNFFVRSTDSAMTSLTNNLDMLNRIYIPPSVFVAAAIGGAFINLLFASGSLLVLALVDGVYPTIYWLFLPIPIILATCFAVGVGAAAASLALFFVDIINMYDVLTRVYFYLTPIIYPVGILPPLVQRAEILNPMFGIVNAFRQPLMDGRLPPLNDLGITAALSVSILLTGWFIFTRMANRFGNQI